MHRKLLVVEGRKDHHLNTASILRREDRCLVIFCNGSPQPRIAKLLYVNTDVSIRLMHFNKYFNFQWLLASTALATGMSMLALGLWFYITSLSIWLPGWLPVAAMCLCIFADAAGYQPVPYVITSELFSFQVKFLYSLGIFFI